MNRQSPPPITKSIQVRCSQMRAFDVFTADLPSWWPVKSHSISAGRNALPQSCEVELREGGAIYEIDDKGTRHDWGTVTRYDPHRRFEFDWFVGRTPEEATKVSVDFTPLGPEMTQVTLTHSDWQKLGDRAAEVHAGYDSGWELVFASCFRQACGESHGLES